MADTDVLRIPIDTRQVTLGIRALSKLATSGQAVSDTIAKLSSRFTELSTAMQSLSLVTDAIKNFREFEKGLIEVGKTTGFVASELQDFGDGLSKITLSMPVTTKEILSISKAAGQLGLKGSDNVLKFSKVIAKLGFTTDLAGEAASNALARLLLITDESFDQAERLASQLVILGNNVAATESEIISLAGEVGRATSVFKIGSGAAVAFGATLAQLGVRSELAGSSIGRTFRALDASIRERGESFERLSVITGTTDAMLIKTFSRSKATVFLQFLKGLKAIDDAGGDVNSVLASFGLRGEEILKVIPTLAISLDKLLQNFLSVGEQVKSATALQNEYERTLITLNSKLILLTNTFGEVSTKIGGLLVDFFKIKEATVLMRESLIQLFDLPSLRTIDIVKKELDQADKILSIAKEVSTIGSVFDTISDAFDSIFNDGSLSIRQNEIQIAFDTVIKLESELAKLEDTAEKTAEKLKKVAEKTVDLRDVTKTTIDVESILNDQYAKRLKALELIEPKMTVYGINQMRLTEEQNKTNKSLRQQNREIGLTESQLQDLIITRSEEAVELAKLNNASRQYVDSLRDQVTILRSRKSLKNVYKSETEALEKNNKLLSTIEGHSRTIFKAFFESGKSAFEALTQILKDTLIEALFELTVKKWVINIVSNIVDGSQDGGIFGTFSRIVSPTGGTSGGQTGLTSGQRTAISTGAAVVSGFVPTTTTTAIGTTAGTASGSGSLAASITTGLIRAGIGAITAELTDGNPATGALGGAIGGAIGSVVGGPIGAFIGSAIGGAFGGFLGKKPPSPILKGAITRTEQGEFTTSQSLRNVSQASSDALQDVLDSQIVSLKALVNVTRLQFADINRDVQVFRIDLLKTSSEGIRRVLFTNLKRLISEGVLENVPPALTRALKAASGGDEIQQAIDAWLNARTAFEDTLRGISEIPLEVSKVEIALNNLNNQFMELGEQSRDLGADLELLDDAYESSVDKLRSEFIKGIGDEIRKLTDPDGAALVSIREWRTSMIKDAVLLGADIVQIERLFNIKRLNLSKKLTSEALSELSRSIESEKRTISNAANDVTVSISGFTETLSTLNDALIEIQSIGAIQTKVNIESSLSLLEKSISFAKKGGELSEFAGFTDALSSISNVDERLFRTEVDFRRVIGQSEALILSLIKETEEQLTTEEMSLESINTAVDRLDRILKESEDQVNVLLGIDDNVKSVPIAIASLGTEILRAGGEFKSVPSFSTGTNFVPFNTIANIHAGERIIPAADNRVLLSRLNGNGDGTSSQEIIGLRQDLVALNTALVLNVKKIKRIMERQDAEGLPPERIAA